ALLFVSNFLLLVAVYATNSFFGFKADRLNPRFRDSQFESPVKYVVMSVVTLIASLILLHVMNPRLPILGGFSYLLWVFYSCPGGAKGRPIWGTLVHLFGQVLQFHLCVMAFIEPTLSTLTVSVYFGLLFASGHLMHEVKDHDSDALAGVRTNSVAYGQERVISFYRIVVALIPIYWTALRAADLLTNAQFVPFLLASIAHAIFTFIGSGKRAPGTETYQSLYRVFYLVAGVTTFYLAYSES
ncbi:MAG: UbiA family prenyltransferase, partial [Bdellovibrionota bacterium]